MNKLFTTIGAVAITLVSLSSCCGKGSCSTDSCNSELTDSISIAQGTYIGDAVLSNYPMMNRSGSVSKEDIIKGIQIVLGANDTQGTQIGLQFGLQMINEMKQLEGMGIKVDRSLMLNSFKKAFLQDSIDQNNAQQALAEYQNLINKAQSENSKQ